MGQDYLPPPRTPEKSSRFQATGQASEPKPQTSQSFPCWIDDYWFPIVDSWSELENELLRHASSLQQSQNREPRGASQIPRTRDLAGLVNHESQIEPERWGGQIRAVSFFEKPRRLRWWGAPASCGTLFMCFARLRAAVILMFPSGTKCRQDGGAPGRPGSFGPSQAAGPVLACRHDE